MPGYGFDSSLAVFYGVNEAIVINALMWIEQGASIHDDEECFRDGRYWYRSSNESFARLFPFWSDDQVRRILNSLVHKGAVIRGNFNEHPMDHTCWYTLAPEISEKI